VRCTTVRRQSQFDGLTSSNKKENDAGRLTFRKWTLIPMSLYRVSGLCRVKTISFVWVRITHSHVGAQSELSIEKQCWDHISRSIDEAIHPERQAEIAAVVMQTGLCTFVSCHGA
jgi:hypothetical protein